MKIDITYEIQEKYEPCKEHEWCALVISSDESKITSVYQDIMDCPGVEVEVRELRIVKKTSIYNEEVIQINTKIT